MEYSMSIHSMKNRSYSWVKSTIAMMLAIGMVGMCGCDKKKEKKKNRKRVESDILHQEIEEKLNQALAGPSGIGWGAISDEVDKLMEAIKCGDFDYVSDHTNLGGIYTEDNFIPLYKAEASFLTYSVELVESGEDYADIVIHCEHKNGIMAMHSLMEDKDAFSTWVMDYICFMLVGSRYSFDPEDMLDYESLAEYYKEKLENTDSVTVDISCRICEGNAANTYQFLDGDFDEILPVTEPWALYHFEDEDMYEIYSLAAEKCYEEGRITEREKQTFDIAFNPFPMDEYEMEKYFENRGFEESFEYSGDYEKYDENLLFEIEDMGEFDYEELWEIYFEIQDLCKSGELKGQLSGNALDMTFEGIYDDYCNGDKIRMRFFASGTYVIAILVDMEDEEAFAEYQEIMDELGWIA